MSVSGEAANLIHEFSFTSQLSPPLEIGPTPVGVRMVFPAGPGTVTGERLRGTFLSGADWLLVGNDGFGRVDVRGQIETHDGAFIYIHYHGFLEMNETVGGALQSGAATQFADAYFRTSPRLECGDPRYAWVNHTLFVGAGRLLKGGTVEYKVYRVS
ncbi:DUF3237 domain-containing protein [Polycyclovorans algicola]|uniref:DUF3237 domain-containing protein n=1 Tax=Polycyclovorans algicola TaxID=616992 RepID=UPI0006943996|nr:DUF3237 domain-containing protein [Polycyclovorans algicola]